MHKVSYNKKRIWTTLIVSALFINFNMILFVKTYFYWVNGELTTGAYILLCAIILMTGMYGWSFYESIKVVLAARILRKQFDEADRCRERLKILHTPDAVLPCKECKNKNYCWNRYRIY